MVRTKDGVEYEGGMTLYEISQTRITPIAQTYLVGTDRFQTIGSPSHAGFIPNFYASDQAAIREIIRELDERIQKAQAERQEWVARLA